jgi:hypothetical protein
MASPAGPAPVRYPRYWLSTASLGEQPTNDRDRFHYCGGVENDDKAAEPVRASHGEREEMRRLLMQHIYCGGGRTSRMMYSRAVRKTR